MRNVKPRTVDEEPKGSDESGYEKSVPLPEGGASGVPDLHHMGGEPMVAPVARDEVPPKQYRVLNGGFIVYNNSRTILRQGKIIHEGAYDLAKLVAQGIKLEEIV